jgi:hypothetical protein
LVQNAADSTPVVMVVMSITTVVPVVDMMMMRPMSAVIIPAIVGIIVIVVIVVVIPMPVVAIDLAQYYCGGNAGPNATPSPPVVGFRAICRADQYHESEHRRCSERYHVRHFH